MFHVLCGYISSVAPDSVAPNTIDSFDPFNTLELINFLLTPSFAIAYVCHDVWHGSCPGERDAMLRINREAVMWKITTCGLTLEEVLIMAAMNLLANADTAAKRENRASQKSKGDQDAKEVLNKRSSRGRGRSGARIHHFSRTGEPIRN
jgi:hypothetical protein